MSIEKSISLWTYFLVHIFYAHERKPLNTPIATCGAMFEFGFIWTFVINVFQKILKLLELLQVFMVVISRKLSYLFSFSNSIVYCIDGSWLFRMSKNCNDCSLLLNLAWLSSTNLLKVFGAKIRLRAYVMDMFTILWR